MENKERKKESEDKVRMKIIKKEKDKEERIDVKKRKKEKRKRNICARNIKSYREEF